MMRSMAVHPSDTHFEMADNMNDDSNGTNPGEDYNVVNLPSPEAADDQTAVNGVPVGDLRHEWQATAREGKKALLAIGKFGFRLGKATGKSSLVAAKSAFRQCKEAVEKYNEKPQTVVQKSAETREAAQRREPVGDRASAVPPDDLMLLDAEVIDARMAAAIAEVSRMEFPKERESARSFEASGAGSVSAKSVRKDGWPYAEDSILTAPLAGPSGQPRFDSEDADFVHHGSATGAGIVEAQGAPTRRVVATSSRSPTFSPMVPLPANPASAPSTFDAGTSTKSQKADTPDEDWLQDSFFQDKNVEEKAAVAEEEQS